MRHRLLLWMFGLLALMASLTMASTREVKRAPFLTATQVAYGGNSWVATLDGNGLLIVKTAERVYRRQLPTSRIRAFLATMHGERFRDLEETYGTPVYDANYREISFNEHGHSKTIALFSDLASDRRPGDVQRALRVAIAIRDLFEAPEAYDSRPGDRALIEKLNARLAVSPH